MKKQLNIKKLILLNLPYILMGLFATNFGEGMADGRGCGRFGKNAFVLLHAAGGAASWWPSLHPWTCWWAVLRRWPAAGGVSQKQERQEVRHGMEYGSARWGTREDIAPYVDPVFQNNVILTKTESLTMNSRPKDPKTARNKNILVIGGSGSGKTRFFCKPSLLQAHRPMSAPIRKGHYNKDRKVVKIQNRRLHT